MTAKLMGTFMIFVLLGFILIFMFLSRVGSKKDGDHDDEFILQVSDMTNLDLSCIINEACTCCIDIYIMFMLVAIREVNVLILLVKTIKLQLLAITWPK